jgi:hypothetical protein
MVNFSSTIAAHRCNRYRYRHAATETKFANFFKDYSMLCAALGACEQSAASDVVSIQLSHPVTSAAITGWKHVNIMHTLYNAAR